MISGDRLPDLDPARLDILTRVLPTYGVAARPLDLFDRDRPELFALHVQSTFGAWWLVGYFHWDEEAEVTRILPLSRLGLSPAQSYLVYTFWTQQLVAESNDAVTLRFPPATVHLLAIHPKQGRPQVLGTDRHYTQGAIELTRVQWDAMQNTLSGLALGAPGQSWTLTIYVPAGFAWAADMFSELSLSPGVVVQAYEPPLLRLQLTFTNTDRLAWSVVFIER
jgi:hypothetical protein